MKVLFAVSSESISEAIIKRYQKEYKEILSYKNVYYFNAILKEIQKDKTYDRIVISEDLEPFSNNNYDTIDKFIFEKLDSISDEAHDSQGKETSIILICTDRRVKGSSILVKLFGIGVYNALLGNDRSMEEVCKLINRPRSKKEAKMYYRIDSEDVDYKAEKENEVSEVEIQNILAHFKKLNKNTAKYVESFNNIAVQYTDEQLRIIVNCLPINVKAVLEANSEKYQQLMAVTGGIQSVKGVVGTTVEGAIKNEVQSKNIGQAGQISKPIVIPSAVRNSKQGANARIRRQVTKEAEPAQIQQPVGQQAQATQQPQTQVQQPVGQQPQAQVKQQATQVGVNNTTQQPQTNVVQQPQQARPAQQAGPIRRTRVIPGQPAQNSPQARTVQPQPTAEPVRPTVQPAQQTTQINLDGLEEQMPSSMANNANVENLSDEATERRGRGRPRKTPVVGAEVKPKGKRGRPRKIDPSLEQENTEIEDTMLPGFEEESYQEVEQDAMLPGMDAVQDDGMLPGMDEEEYVEDENMLLGFEEEPYQEVEQDTMLPGMDAVVEDDGMLPGMDEEVYEEEYSDEGDMLPGMEETGEEGYAQDENMLPMEDEAEYTEEVALPGLDDLDDIDDEMATSEDTMLPGFGDDEYEETQDDGSMLPGMDDLEDDGMLPGMGDTEDDMLPGMGVSDEYEEEETMLPGMGFEDDMQEENIIPNSNPAPTQNYSAPQNNYNSSSLESIKPKIDYSMSSLNSLITKDKKIVAFIGTSKNGVSFLVESLGAYFSSIGLNTAILDMTQNKNSYYIYTKNEEELRNVAYNSIEKLQNGYAEGIKVDKGLTVYTALPNDGKDYSNAEPILSTLVQNHSLILIDCDYDTDLTYFASCQELYLVQSMDILTIQPLTAFLRELKTNGILEPEKIRVVINKELKVKGLSAKAIIGGLAYYNDPAMSFMTELFNKDMVKACSIPFDEGAYSKYLEGIVNCNISIGGYSKQFIAKLRVLSDMVYPVTGGSKQAYNRPQVDYSQNAFSNSMNNTLNKMKKNY